MCQFEFTELTRSSQRESKVGFQTWYITTDLVIWEVQSANSRLVPKKRRKLCKIAGYQFESAYARKRGVPRFVATGTIYYWLFFDKSKLVRFFTCQREPKCSIPVNFFDARFSCEILKMELGTGPFRLLKLKSTVCQRGYPFENSLRNPDRELILRKKQELKRRKRKERSWYCTWERVVPQIKSSKIN